MYPGPDIWNPLRGCYCAHAAGCQIALIYIIIPCLELVYSCFCWYLLIMNTTASIAIWCNIENWDRNEAKIWSTCVHLPARLFFYCGCIIIHNKQNIVIIITQAHGTHINTPYIYTNHTINVASSPGPFPAFQCCTLVMGLGTRLQ